MEERDNADGLQRRGLVGEDPLAVHDPIEVARPLIMLAARPGPGSRIEPGKGAGLDAPK